MAKREQLPSFSENQNLYELSRQELDEVTGGVNDAVLRRVNSAPGRLESQPFRLRTPSPSPSSSHHSSSSSGDLGGFDSPDHVIDRYVIGYGRNVRRRLE